jgi:hypothetical protein
VDSIALYTLTLFPFTLFFFTLLAAVGGNFFSKMSELPIIWDLIYLQIPDALRQRNRVFSEVVGTVKYSGKNPVSEHSHCAKETGFFPKLWVQSSILVKTRFLSTRTPPKKPGFFRSCGLQSSILTKTRFLTTRA